jgi:hypothetical protein
MCEVNILKHLLTASLKTGICKQKNRNLFKKNTRVFSISLENCLTNKYIYNRCLNAKHLLGKKDTLEKRNLISKQKALQISKYINLNNFKGTPRWPHRDVQISSPSSQGTKAPCE